jgi:DNA adenine methylase
MNSPVNYYGGKSYMTDTLKKHFPLAYKTYVEGFGGGASLLLNKDETPLEIYNDLEKSIYSLFKVISNEDSMKRLQDRLYKCVYSHQLYDEYKSILRSGEDLSIEDRAYYFFYVNRTSFNGIDGFSYNPLVRRGCSKSISSYFSAIDNLETIWSRIQHAIIENRDIFELLDKYDAEDTFFYLDPPYV